MNLDGELKVAKKVAIELGKIQMNSFRKKLRIIRKTQKDFVSNIDMECQERAFKILNSEFNYDILSEEKRDNHKSKSDFYWVLDPIDGTHNYISGLPFFGSSIGLMHKKKFVLGVVFLPYFNELYHAKKGSGAYLNNEKINVSSNVTLEKSMVMYDNQFHLDSNSFDFYKNLVNNTFTTRISGSAVYDSCLVASGRIDARIFNNTKSFDIAASVAIISEAGGNVTDFDGDKIDIDAKKVIISNGLVHDQILNLQKANFKL